MKRVIIIFILIVILAIGTVLGLRIWAAAHVLDKDGMIDPNYTQPGETGEPFMTDGDYTYVDNEKLLEVIAGTWSSTNEQCTLVIEEDYSMVLLVDEVKVLEDVLEFTYLQPGPVSQTDFSINAQNIILADGTNIGEIQYFYHKAGENRGQILIELKQEDGSEETMEFVYKDSL